MTDAYPPASALVRRLPLRGLYPAAYRAAHGEEITAVFAESVRHADRRTTLREWSALAAHALRLRTRLSSRDPGGRLLAGAAPFLLAGGAALNAVHLLTASLTHGPRAGSAPLVLAVVRSVPWLLALLCAAFGRWRPARALVAGGVLTGFLGAAVAQRLPPADVFAPSTGLLWLWACAGALVLVAPPDAVDLSPRNRARTVAAAIAAALPMSGIATLVIGTWPDDYTNIAFTPLQNTALDVSAAWPAFVMAFALLLRLGDPATDPLQAYGVTLAVLPWSIVTAPPLYLHLPAGPPHLLLDGAVALGLLATAAATGLLCRRLRRTREAGSLPPTAGSER
ncbi:hypothetical protein ACFCX4_34530 [Kitasatospora sp. NPDC056327]|uniref:hypothetical protein n=1 Tax=Kitasatospora sp. NPDC056327 TaxID=3345785 RepID=UPI0035E19A9A